MSWRTARRLRFLAVLVVAVVGVLTIHIAFAAPATRAPRPAAATTNVRGGNSARVLLAGSRLYSYDPGARRLQALPLPINAPAAGLHLLAIRGGNVVVAAGGEAYGALLGKPLRPLGMVTGVLPDHDRDAVWLLTGTTAQLAGADGRRLGSSYSIPAGQQVVAAVDAGLLLAPAAPGVPGAVEVVNPQTRHVVRMITPVGAVLDAVGDHVAWSRCGGSGCPIEITQLSTGRTTLLPPLPAGYLPVGSPLLSPDNRHYALPAARLASQTIDLIIGRLPNTPRARPGRVAVRQLMPGSAAVEFARNGSLVVDTDKGLVVLRPGRSLGMAKLTGLPAFTSFAVS